jgi:hypothetical protein
MREWAVSDPETGQTHRFRVAYIHSSEEHREVAAARERALEKAEEQLKRLRNRLGGRYYKTRRQVDTRVARILAGQVENLITVRTGTRNGRKPTPGPASSLTASPTPNAASSSCSKSHRPGQSKRRQT